MKRGGLEVRFKDIVVVVVSKLSYSYMNLLGGIRTGFEVKG